MKSSMTGQETGLVTVEYRWLFKRGDRMDRVDCIYTVWQKQWSFL